MMMIQNMAEAHHTEMGQLRQELTAANERATRMQTRLQHKKDCIAELEEQLGRPADDLKASHQRE